MKQLLFDEITRAIFHFRSVGCKTQREPVGFTVVVPSFIGLTITAKLSW